MDNLLLKFYSNGKEEEQKFTQFGAFSNSLLKNSSTNLNFTTLGLGIPKITIGTINPSIHNMETTTKIPMATTTATSKVDNNSLFAMIIFLLFHLRQIFCAFLCRPLCFEACNNLQLQFCLYQKRRQLQVELLFLHP